MQNKLLSIFSAALFVVLIQSCGDDDKEPETPSTPESFFTYDNKTYELTGGHIDYDYDYDGESEKNFHSIVLLSKGLEHEGEDLKGEGNILYIEVRSEGEEIAEGTYDFVDVDPQIGDMTESFIYLDFDASLEQGGPDSEGFEDCSSGTVKVEKKDGKFNLTFSGVINGDDFSGTYKGVLPEWE